MIAEFLQDRLSHFGCLQTATDKAYIKCFLSWRQIQPWCAESTSNQQSITVSSVYLGSGRRGRRFRRVFLGGNSFSSSLQHSATVVSDWLKTGIHRVKRKATTQNCSIHKLQFIFQQQGYLSKNLVDLKKKVLQYRCGDIHLNSQLL